MSTAHLKMPIGQSNFRRIIQSGYYFVDKTLFIKDMLDDSSAVSLIIRPRRFGKTLMLSMLRYFFAKEVDGESTERLFEGLKIQQEEAIYKQYQGQYPVIFLTFKDLKFRTYEEIYRNFLQLLADIYTEHYYLLKSNVLFDHERKTYVAILEKCSNSETISGALRKLSEYLYRYHKISPLILIDEYDTPIHYGYLHGYYSEIVGLIRNLLGPALKDNPYCFKAVLTGILRVSKESLFSDLNNVSVYSVLQERYSEYFGFTEEEVQRLLKATDLEEYSSDIRSWYNGYQMGTHTIYNPWSILNCVKEGGQLERYWLNTSDNALLKQCLYRSHLIDQGILESFLEGKTYRCLIDNNIVLSNLNFASIATKDILSFLLMAGYFKPVSIEYTERGTLCELAIPNIEVRGLYADLIECWLLAGQSNILMNEFLDALLNGDMLQFEESFRFLLEHTISVHDLANRPEAFYHGFMTGLTANLQSHPHYALKSNRESGYGRYDYLILSRRPEKPSLLIEFKRVQFPRSKEVSADEIDAALQKAADEALQQMENKAYDTEAKQQRHHILKIAIAFYGKHFKLIYKNEH